MKTNTQANMDESNKTVIISANTSWYVYNFRLSLIKELQKNGHFISVVAPYDEYTNRLKEAGCFYSPIALDNKGTNPLRELKTFFDYRLAYSRIHPAIILHFTPKPNIFGTLAANSLGIPCVNNIAGLGTAFNQSGVLSKIVKFLYRFSQRNSYRVFFQNQDDLSFFIQSGLVNRNQTDLLPGSGVDLEKFAPRGGASSDGVCFLLIARLIWAKGISEFVEAARLVKQNHPSASFKLLGFIDNNNPGAVSEKSIRDWETEGLLTWLGKTDDVRPYIAESDCVVLPSYYREGTPKTLLEAASMAKPLITTDASGCREVVEDEINGFLCRLRDHQDLADKMIRMIEIGPEARKEMGLRGREKMVREYNEKIIFHKYLQVIAGGIKS